MLASLHPRDFPAGASTPVTGEPLPQLARFALDWAGTLCAETGCADYHRGWSAIRAHASNGGRPSRIEDFLPALRSVARDGGVRILISGSADTGLAAALLDCLRPAGIEPRIVISDVCRTPLAQNELFARHARFALETRLGPVADLDVSPVDAVVSHSFLGFVDPRDRAATVRAWARNLRPGGVLLYSAPVVDGESDRRAVSTPEEIEIAARRVAEGARVAGEGDPEAMGRAAAAFWAHQVPHRQPTETEITALFQESGLAVRERRLCTFRKFGLTEAFGREARDYRLRLNLVAERT
jgi:SAM-dependent methyltransferase